ncbi:hypothetical protein LRAMOSA10097 [Lichtheimia ramosa]|uniref:Uncharacterized protein n=1 Tax=Lichtheimia ramosa TaxID=688394 RepID=A0A077WM31_9FUNG|nr:hypothetical protein LRAMOSA10097 [Lichtheimia ramosa]
MQKILNFTVAATSFTFIDKSKFIKMRFLISTLAAAIAILSVVSAAPQGADRSVIDELNALFMAGGLADVADKLKTKPDAQRAGGR